MATARRWNFSAAYDSGLLSEAQMCEIVTGLNERSTRYEYQYRTGRGTPDWIVEYRRK